MGFEVRVTGGDQLRQVRNKLRAIDDKGLGRQMSRAIQRAARPLKPAIVAEANAVMPESGGYRAILTKSLGLRTSIKESRTTARVQIKVFASGKGENRDVPRLNKGELRHPNPPGRFRRKMWTDTKPRKRIPGGQLVRNDWSTTKIRRGFVDRPADKLLPDMVREMNAVIDYVADQIGG